MSSKRKANAKLLADLLQDLGYNKKLQAASLECAFEHPETRHVLEWLVHQDFSKQVLSKDEREQYAELVESGQVLHGADLEAKFCQVVAAEQLGEGGSGAATAEGQEAEDPLDPLSSPALVEAEHEALQEELCRIEKDKEALLCQQQVVRSQIEQVRCQREAAAVRIAAAEAKLTEARQKCIALAGEADVALQSIGDHTTKLGNALLPGPDGAGGKLLCTLPMEAYVHADLAYSRALERLRPKRGEDTSVADALPNPGPSESRDALQTELSRLQDAFRVSERERISAAAQHAAAEAELHAVRALLDSGRPGEGELERQKAEEASGRIAHLEAERQQLLQEIEGLLAKVSLKQDHGVLREDYRRKIERQERLNSQLEEYLQHILKQAAWHRVLETALAMEAQQIRGVTELFAAAEADVLSMADGCDVRRRAYAVAQQEVPTRLTIRSDDRLLQDLAVALGVSQQDTSNGVSAEASDGNGLMSGEVASAGYVEVAKLKEKVQEVWRGVLKPDRGHGEQLRQQQETALRMTQSTVESLNADVFGSPGGLEPVMAPASLPESIRGLKSVNGALLKAVDDVAVRYATKAEQVSKQGPAAEAARNVFCWFHTDRERLVQEVLKMEACSVSQAHRA